MSGPQSPQWRPRQQSGARNVMAAPVLVSRGRAARDGQRAERYLAMFDPPPPMTDRDVEVAAVRLGPWGAIDEHAADEPILLIALAGAGRTRVGGEGGAWHDLAPGDAVVWPEAEPHALEAGADGLEVRLVHLGGAD